MERILAVIFFAAVGRATCGDFPELALTEPEKVALHGQAKLTPGARQMGLGCAFYANVPVLTIASGVNIADGSEASRKYVSQIYGLRKGDFRFSSAFDRGCFVSLRVLGEFGGPHNVLLMAHHRGKFYHHEPRTGRIVSSTSAELASRILTVSKERSKLRKRYFSSWHEVALPAPEMVGADFRTPAGFPKELEIALTPEKGNLIAVGLARDGAGKGVTVSFPKIDFATKGDGDRSLIDKDLDVPGLYGIYSISKLALNSHHSGKRRSLPVWLMDGKPLALVGYSEGNGVRLTFSDGKKSSTMKLGDALGRFRDSGRYLGYIAIH